RRDLDAVDPRLQRGNHDLEEHDQLLRGRGSDAWGRGGQQWRDVVLQRRQWQRRRPRLPRKGRLERAKGWTADRSGEEADHRVGERAWGPGVSSRESAGLAGEHDGSVSRGGATRDFHEPAVVEHLTKLTDGPALARRGMHEEDGVLGRRERAGLAGIDVD